MTKKTDKKLACPFCNNPLGHDNMGTAHCSTLGCAGNSLIASDEIWQALAEGKTAKEKLGWVKGELEWYTEHGIRVPDFKSEEIVKKIKSTDFFVMPKGSPVLVGYGAKRTSTQRTATSIKCLMPVEIKIDENGDVEYYVTKNLDGTGDIIKAKDQKATMTMLEKRLDKAWELYFRVFQMCSGFCDENAVKAEAKSRWDAAMNEIKGD